MFPGDGGGDEEREEEGGGRRRGTGGEEEEGGEGEGQREGEREGEGEGKERDAGAEAGTSMARAGTADVLPLSIEVDRVGGEVRIGGDARLVVAGWEVGDALWYWLNQLRGQLVDVAAEYLAVLKAVEELEGGE